MSDNCGCPEGKCYGYASTVARCRRLLEGEQPAERKKVWLEVEYPSEGPVDLADPDNPFSKYVMTAVGMVEKIEGASVASIHLEMPPGREAWLQLAGNLSEALLLVKEFLPPDVLKAAPQASLLDE